jgi:cytochrome P450
MSGPSPEVMAALFDPMSPAFRADPYPLYARLREVTPATATPLGSVIVTRYEPVDRVLRSSGYRSPRGYREPDDPAGPARFDPAGALTRHRRHQILFQSGETHARLRRLITKVFTPRAVRELAPRVEAIVDQLLAPALERGAMEVIDDLAFPLPSIVICELLGVPPADRDRNRAWASATAPTLDPVCSPEQLATAERAMSEWDDYMHAFVADRRAHPGSALIDAMLAVEDEGSQLSEDEVVANATFLFAAGHETTTNLIGNGLLALLRHPEQLAALQRDPSGIENAIEELLRYDSPVQFAARVALESTAIEGAAVEPGVVVMLALGSANRDPRRYDRPDQLDVRRADVKPLSFGGGPHYCIGAALARLEGRIALAGLLSRARSIELAGDRIAWRPTLTLRGLERLDLALSV